LALFDLAERLGSAGRLIGVVVTLLYFGLMNSRLGGGQTLGKRMLGIRVVDKSGRLLSPGRSTVRFVVFAAPYFLDGLWFDVDPTTMGPGQCLLFLLLTFVVFGGGGAIIYLFVFNSHTRQSLHDLVVGSFVIRSSPAAAPIGLSTPCLHLVITGCWLALSMVVPGAAVLFQLQSQTDVVATFQPLADLQVELNAQAGIRQAEVTVGRTLTPATATDFLRVDAQASPGQTNLDALVLQIADAVLARDPNLFGKQLLVVRAARSFDFGIVSWSYAHSETHSSTAWRERSRQRGSKPDI
jgi:uncharacterized RDD family membrane protein YckC